MSIKTIISEIATAALQLRNDQVMYILRLICDNYAVIRFDEKLPKTVS